MTDGQRPDDRRVKDKRYRHRRAALYLMSLLVAGTIGGLLADWAEDAAGWMMVVLGGCLTLWAAADARYHRRPLPTLSLWVVLLFWPIAVPACVIRAYGWLAGGIYIVLHIILLAFLFYAPWFLVTIANPP